MKKTKKNNKGFSLVELIVVILIMAILGVALAPQVLRWVNNSKIATDSSNYDALFDAAQIAATTNPPSAALTVKFNNSGVELDNASFAGKLADILPELGSYNATDKKFTGIKIQQSGTHEFTFTVNTDGSVTKGTTPNSGDIS